MPEMLGRATSKELIDLYFDLSMKTAEQRKAIPFALFTASKGLMNGEEAYIYLKAKMEA